jgi:hypothetical protein
MYKTPEPLEMPPLQSFRRWLWPQKQDYARLQREFDSFRVELALLEARSQQSDKSWALAAQDQLGNVAHHLKKKDKDVEGGWVCLHAARRHAIHGLGPEGLPMQASILRAEATKFLSWRAKEMQNLLSVKDEQLTANHITNAMALRDEYFSNQYHKIWLMGHQLAILLISSGLGLFLLAPLVVFYSRHPEGTLAPWGYQMVAAVLFFGLLGAAFSAAGSLINAGADARIPERVANQFVTSARALFGAGAGLAGYAFYQSKTLDIRVGSESGPGGALAVAFLFGFAGEQLIAHVLGALGPRKS